MTLARPSVATHALVAARVCLVVAPHAQSREPVALVSGGQVRGARVAGGAVFKGVPYAAPPVGELRWREPQPVCARTSNALAAIPPVSRSKAIRAVRSTSVC